MGHRVSVLYLMMNYQVLDGMAALGFFFHLTNNVCIHLWCPV
jgi:hypothetical protein